MPELCRFFGIVIRMYASDHPPPHFHVEYAEHEAQISIGDGLIMRGSLPAPQRRLVMQWAAQRETALLAAWAKASADEPPGTIEPL